MCLPCMVTSWIGQKHAKGSEGLVCLFFFFFFFFFFCGSVHRMGMNAYQHSQHNNNYTITLYIIQWSLGHKLAPGYAGGLGKVIIKCKK